MLHGVGALALSLAPVALPTLAVPGHRSVVFSLPAPATLPRPNPRPISPLVAPPEVKVTFRAPAAAARRPEVALPPQPIPRVETPAAPIVIAAPVLPPPLRPAVRTEVFAGIPAAAAVTSSPALGVGVGTFAAAGSGMAPHRRASSVAASGFGEATAAPVRQAARREVRQAAFGDVVAAPAAPRPRTAAGTAGATSGVEIVSKPRPSYSEEARRLRIEGDVVLEVLFSATGELRVLSVVRGLGYGLDENAAAAARRIRFKPALEDGRPVDSSATLRVTFQLAY